MMPMSIEQQIRKELVAQYIDKADTHGVIPNFVWIELLKEFIINGLPPVNGQMPEHDKKAAAA